MNLPTSFSTLSSSPNRTLNRRSFIGGLAATAATVALAPIVRAVERDWSGKNPTRYPDPDIISLDPKFDRYKLGNTPLQRIYHSDSVMWAEGIAWNAVGRYAVWSDIPNDRQLRWIEDDGRVTTFRQPCGNSNGNTFDFEGRQISCEHGNRRVVRYEHNGKVTVLADKFNGKQLNAPNDVIVHPDGGIWFTDPGYGSMMNYEGNKGELLVKEAVYRIDGKTGKMEIIADELDKPNGLCFSPDYKKLYIADTGKPRDIQVCDILDGTKVKKPRQFTNMVLPKQKIATRDGDRYIGGAGGSDGIRCDVDGNVWSAAGWHGDGYDGVHVFTPAGQRIGMILLPEICANLCFGGRKRNRLFMAASTSIYAMYVETQGAHIS